LWNDQPNKKCHKDIDTRWTKKNNETFYGYKGLIKVDNKSKLINTYYVTDASVHYTHSIENLLTDKDRGQNLHADSAYTGEKQNEIKKTLKCGTCFWLYGAEYARTMCLKSVGIERATAIIGMINLTYNIFRYEQIIRLDIA